MVFGIIGILLLAGVLLGKISWGWAVLGAIFLYWYATRFWKKYKAASNAILARHTFNLLSELDRKEVLAAVSAIMSNAKYPSQDPEEELKSMTPEQRYGFIALGMARIGITPKLGGGWYEIHNPYAEILGAHREIAFVKHQIRLRYGVDVNFGDVVASTVQQSGLVPQDLPASQQSKQPALPKDNDALYRQARAEFDQRNERQYRRKCKNRALLPDFKIFQQLANENYGKAYYPLSVLYGNRGDIEEGAVLKRHYEQMALDWCSANQNKQDVELWCDLGSTYEYQNGELAVYWYRKAAEQGYIRAQLRLGDHFGLCEEDAPHHDDEEAVKWYRLAANQGDAVAQLNLGLRYASGEGVPQDYEEAVKWLQLAADQGDTSAQRNLALKYVSGEGVPQDYEKVVKWLRLAADQGDGNSQYYLGLMYGNGEGVPQDCEEAVKWYQLAADQGYAKAQNALGQMYCNGEGVPQDYEEAAKWYRLAADKGNADAQVNLGGVYYQGQGVSQDYEEAAKWYRLAAAQGNDLAQLDLAVMCVEGKCAPQDHKEIEDGIVDAVRPAGTWPMFEAKPAPKYDKEEVYSLCKSAEQGDAEEQLRLGDMYSGYDGFEKNDEQAAYWYRKAAEQGDSTGQVRLGDMYREGRGIDRDDEQAVYWFLKAAKQQDDKGQVRLGDMYREGRGVEKNYEQAMYWYQKSTEQGHCGFRELGDMYKEGLGVDKDVGMAKYWYGQEPRSGYGVGSE